jgi:uncharacterized protein with HEPN domain
MSPSNLELLRHIYDELNFMLESTKGKEKEEVINDGALSRAVIRSLEIIGEPSEKIYEEFKISHNHIEWKKIAGTRDKLIHDYFGVDSDIVWNIVSTKLPDLR